MTVVQTSPNPSSDVLLAGSRKREIDTPMDRVRRDGKFFRLGELKFCVRGVTYGSFAENEAGEPFKSPAQTRTDFELIKELNANTIRIYRTPPKWFLDLAAEMGLKVFLDIAWGKNVVFVEDDSILDDARERVRTAARECGNHPAIFALSVVNEIAPDIVRYIGAKEVAEFIDELVEIVKEEAPHCLTTFANFPPTEYLQPKDIDFVTYNVYLHEENALRNYVVRLHHIAGEKPLVLGEYGIDTHHEGDEARQAEILGRQFSAVYDEGVAGAFVFSFTDEWNVNGYEVPDWSFGLVRRDRSRKPAFDTMREVFRRAPQTTSLKLPRVSVIVCSYNGGSTTESCLRSMKNIRYPDFEVVFVDDGSTDNTQEILKKFPWVRNIKQKNMGLSYARNVGMQAATGEIIVYTDSDCEADEDWLYYLVMPMVRFGNIGAGGPNLIPDEGSWLADCVGLSPGGPTHVMLDDRTAEHVPGCNMGYWRWAAMEINGFDSQFRKAGDDVDFIWRLQHRGHSIGFAPAAQVWHYRRNTVKAYLKQQRGYGEAEALLKYKHPDHFNTLGAGLWRGRIYGADIGIRFGKDVIYHGVFGTGFFQTIYRRQASVLAMMLMSIEWMLLTMFVWICAIAFTPLIWVAGLMMITPPILAAIAAWQVDLPTKRRHWLMRPMIAYLHLRQPIVRGLSRYTVRLKAKTLDVEKLNVNREKLPFDPKDRSVLLYWSKYDDRMRLLEQIKRDVAEKGLRYRIDAGWRDWDIEIYGSRYVKIRLRTVTEHFTSESRLTKVQVRMLMSTFCKVLMGASVFLAGFIGYMMWPFSRPAMLIPVVWWAMYLVNRTRVSRTVLGLVDQTAEKAGYFPVWPKEK
jgi:glycosyltransferase involved in cell wall biosynthesis/exo-beta-1,3-glucanase (GH17 family)